MINILVVEDDKPISDLIKMSLKRVGYLCDTALDGEIAIDKINEKTYDLILLDIMLPKVNGFEILEYIEPRKIPVIFLTAKNSVEDKVKGLRMGAEDYIVKPFETTELLARVDVVLRRYNKTENVINIAGLKIDMVSMKVSREDKEINKEKYLQVSGALKVGKEKCYLDVAYDISPIYEERDKLQQIYYEVFAIMIVLCGILSYSNSFIMTRPLVRLSRTSKAIAAGNISYRSRIKSKDEIGTMAREFDKMTDKLENNIIELKDTMESQNQFIGNFTHELKTPMTSIIGYADLLRSQALTQDEQIEAANYIFSEGKRLERLSLKLLDIFVTENSEVKMVAVSPGKIVEQLVENLKADYLKRNIILKCNYEKGICLLEPDLVRSLVINLMDNSRKAMMDVEHGTIDISVKMIDNGCTISVKDNGKGMPKEALQHITEAFYRVDKSRSRKQGGAGLGLALCAKIVEIHNGDIEFQSKENEGTTVIVKLKGGRA